MERRKEQILRSWWTGKDSQALAELTVWARSLGRAGDEGPRYGLTCSLALLCSYLFSLNSSNLTALVICVLEALHSGLSNPGVESPSPYSRTEVPDCMCGSGQSSLSYCFWGNHGIKIESVDMLLCVFLVSPLLSVSSFQDDGSLWLLSWARWKLPLACGLWLMRVSALFWTTELVEETCLVPAALTPQRTSGHWYSHLAALGDGRRERQGGGMCVERWKIDSDIEAFEGRKSLVKIWLVQVHWGPSGTIEHGCSKPRELSWDLNPSTNSSWLCDSWQVIYTSVPRFHHLENGGNDLNRIVMRHY